MTRSEKRPDWTGQAALAWVIDEAPVPPDLAWTLVVIARRCDKNGRGSYQSISTLATKTGKSEKQARRDVGRLIELKLIEPGDQTLVGHLPAGRRPIVYDIVMSTTGVKPTRPARGKPTTPAHGSTDVGGTPDVHGTRTPPVDVPLTPPVHGSQRKTLKKTSEKDSTSLSSFDLDSLEEPPEDYDEREDLSSQDSQPEEPEHPYVMQRGYLTAAGVTDGTEMDVMPALVEMLNNVEKPRAWWPHVHKNGTLPACIAEARATMADSGKFDSLFATSGTSTTDRVRFAQELHDMPKCVHGTNGGHVVFEPTGWVKCAHERKRLEALPRDGRHVSTERELADGWKPQGYQPYRNPPDRDYDDWLAEGPPAPQKDYRTGTL